MDYEDIIKLLKMEIKTLSVKISKSCSIDKCSEYEAQLRAVKRILKNIKKESNKRWL